MIEKNQIIKLNNNIEYFVANTIIYNNERYAILININLENDYLIVLQKKNKKLTIIDNQKNKNYIFSLLKEDLI